MSGIAVVLAEDSGRTLLRHMLRDVSGVEVVGAAADGRTALALIAALQPAVALVQWLLPEVSGLEITTRTVREYPQTRILIAASDPAPHEVAQALRAGASGYLVQEATDPTELDVALRAVASGHTYLSPAVTRPVIDVFVRSVPPAPGGATFRQLSPRQHEILQLITRGNSTRAIAQQLGLSVKTIETHRAQLMRRLEIRDVAGLVRYAIRAGIITADA